MEKKNHKVLKIMLLIILLILIIFIINTVRNYIIISKIFDKQLELAKITNYSFTKEQYTESKESEKIVLEFYRKNNNHMMVSKKTDGTLITWSNEETKESIIMMPNTMQAVVNNVGGVYIDIPATVHSDSENTEGIKLMCSALSIILPDKIDNEECYYMNLSGYEMWVSKDTGLRLKEYQGHENIDGKKHKCVIEYKNYKFNEVKEEDVARPNLTGYEI